MFLVFSETLRLNFCVPPQGGRAHAVNELYHRRWGLLKYRLYRSYSSVCLKQACVYMNYSASAAFWYLRLSTSFSLLQLRFPDVVLGLFFTNVLKVFLKQLFKPCEYMGESLWLFLKIIIILNLIPCTNTKLKIFIEIKIRKKICGKNSSSCSTYFL